MLLDTIKAEALAARKSRAADKASLLTTLLGEIDTSVKAGRSDTSDASITAIIKKFLKNVNEMLDHSLPGTTSHGKAFDEKHILESFLPKQLTEDELSRVIDDAIANGGKNVGEVMKMLKTSHAGLFDGAAASKILKGKF